VAAGTEFGGGCTNLCDICVYVRAVSMVCKPQELCGNQLKFNWQLRPSFLSLQIDCQLLQAEGRNCSEDRYH